MTYIPDQKFLYKKKTEKHNYSSKKYNQLGKKKHIQM